jgi:LmbE family N-acetylglucosaminyl deacetylase
VSTVADKAFNPSMAGTPEETWQRALDTAPQWSPRKGSPLLVVAPHPDDETLGAGGLIATWSGNPFSRGAEKSRGPEKACVSEELEPVPARRRVTVLSVTDGEASHPMWHGLAYVRRAELRRALTMLCGSGITLAHLGLPDGGVRQRKDHLVRAIEEHLAPGVTLIAPFEHDGHPDHECVGEVCLELAAARGLDIARYPIWAWHHMRPGGLGAFRWGRFPLNREARSAKSLAMRRFDSQLHNYFGTTIVTDHVQHYFHRPYETFAL